MNSIITLTKILLKSTNFELTASNKKKKSSLLGKILMGLLVIYGFGVLVFMCFYMSDAIMEQFTYIGLPNVGFELLLVTASILIFFFAIFMVPTIYYFSEDIQSLLPLPIKPYQIFTAKFIVTLLYEYLTTALIYIPMVIAYVLNVEVGFFFYIQAIVTGLLLPILPMVLGMVIIMLLMRFSKIMRNRDRFNMIIGCVYLVLCLAAGFTIGAMDPEASNELIASLLQNKEAFGIVSKVIPSLSFAVEGIANNNVVSFVISILIPLGVLYLVIMLSNALYFKGVIGINDSSSKRKKLNATSIDKGLSSRGVLWTYTKKEIALLFRTPTYFINCVLSNYMWIIMSAIMYISFSLSADEEMKMILPLLRQGLDAIDIDLYNVDLLVIALGISTMVGILTSSTNGIAATAISREGTNIGFMKYIPVSYRKQLDAKALSSILISLTGALPLLLTTIWLLKLPFIYLLISIVGSCLGVTFLGYLGLLIDVIKPKLLWDTEKVAVKNNFNSIIVMLISIAGIVSLIVILVTLNIDIVPAIVLIIAIVTAITVFIYFRIEKVAITKFKHIL